MYINMHDAVIELDGVEGRKMEDDPAFARDVRDSANRVSAETGRTALVFVDGEEYARFSADVGRLEIVGVDYD